MQKYRTTNVIKSNNKKNDDEKTQDIKDKDVMIYGKINNDNKFINFLKSIPIKGTIKMLEIDFFLNQYNLRIQKSKKPSTTRLPIRTQHYVQLCNRMYPVRSRPWLGGHNHRTSPHASDQTTHNRRRGERWRRTGRCKSIL